MQLLIFAVKFWKALTEHLLEILRCEKALSQKQKVLKDGISENGRNS